MAKTSRLTPFFRIGNMVTTALLKRGVRMATNTLLTVPGRKSGVPRTTPVTIIELIGGRYVQSPFGEVDWVRNLRAAGRATLSRGSHSEEVVAIELTPEEAAPILRQGLMIAPAIIRSYYDVTASSSTEEIVAEAPRHPTFELIGAASGDPTQLRPSRSAHSTGSQDEDLAS